MSIKVFSNEDWHDDILSQFDESANDYSFPIFENSNFPAAGMKIFVFRDDSEWFIVFERLVYSYNEGLFLSLFNGYGNKLAKPGVLVDKENVSQHDDYPIFDDEGEYILDENSFAILIKGVSYYVSFSSEDYKASEVYKYPSMDPGLRMLRVLFQKYSAEMWSSENEVLNRYGKANLPLFLEIEAWNHPLLIGTNNLPSENPCFQSLAKAVASGHAKEYQCLEEINSYWYFGRVE